MKRAILDGILVVDWTQYHQGPVAAAMLADLGAEVIHVEPPGTGDAMRGVVRAHGVNVMRQGRDFLFDDFNRNKKSLTLDLKQAEGRELLLRLVDEADVFLTNHQPSVIRKLALDYEAVAARNPRIIYAAAYGFGKRGPDANARALDGVVSAKSGIMLGCAEEGMPPVVTPPALGDQIAGILMAYGTVAALLARERYGFGQEVSSSILGGLLTAQVVPLLAALMGDTEMHPPNRRAATNPLCNHYLCRDGRWLRFSAQPFEKHWPAVKRSIGQPEWAERAEFAQMSRDSRHSADLIDLLDGVFVQQDASDWENVFRGVDVPCSVVKNYHEVIEDAQVLANQYVLDWDHPVFGPIKTLGFPVEFTRTPATLRSCAPELGQHTEEVLLEHCGCDWADIKRLRQAKVIG